MGETRPGANGEADTRARDGSPSRLIRRAATSRVEMARQFGTIGTVGLSFVIALVIGAWIGLWLDRVTGWSPLFFIVFFLFGLAAGILNVYRAVSRFK